MSKLKQEDQNDQSDNKEMEKLEVEDDDKIEEKQDLKNYLLGGRPPLKTLLDISAGPIVGQLINATYGIVTTFYISRAVGSKGLSALSTYAVFDSMGRSFGFFLSTAGSAMISALFGMKKDDEVHQLSADILRLVVLLSIIIPSIMLPLVKPAARWFGASEEIVQIGFRYIAPLSACMFFSILYIALGGFLMAQGRSGLSSIIMVVTLVLNMGVFAPLFLFGFRWGMMGAAFSTITSEAITGITVAILFFMGKFEVRPTFRMLISKPSPYLWEAVKVGLSTLFGQLSSLIPAIVVRKIMGMACVHDSFDEVMSAYICSFRYMAIVMAIVVAFGQGFIPTASYAFQAHRYKRYLWLTIHAIGITFTWGAIVSVIMWIFPRQLASLFSKEDNFLRYASKQISIVNGFSFLMCFKFIGVGILQSTLYSVTSMISSILNNLIVIILFAYIMYWTDKEDPVRITWCYSLSYMFSFVSLTLFCIKPLYEVWKGSKEMDAEDDDEKIVRAIPEL
jgi:Na+-driven multidrug efflux pump